MAFSINSLSSAAGAAGGAAASALTYSTLQSKYNDFTFPLAKISLNGRPLAAKAGKNLVVNDVHIELTSGYEASVARFKVFNAFDYSAGKFRFDELKSQIFMGAPISIALGYANAVETVFVGFIAGVAFGGESDDMPYIELTAMDVKSVMMGGTYSYRLNAKSYGEAVSKIFERNSYKNINSAGGITTFEIGDTPDKKPGAPGGTDAGGSQKASTETIEMVAESDYEFVVKAAKKFNYEFFVDRGAVIFRKAKSNPTPLASIGVGTGITSFYVEYSITGLVSNIEARTMNAADGKPISAKATRTGTISTSGKAGSIVGSATKVYIDPSITSLEQANARVDSLMEQMKYRLGSLDADCVGIPDLVPGRFVSVGGMGVPADNDFYITTVTHDITSDGGYHTHLIGCAAEMKTTEGAAGGVAGGAAGGAISSFF